MPKSVRVFYLHQMVDYVHEPTVITFQNNGDLKVTSPNLVVDSVRVNPSIVHRVMRILVTLVHSFKMFVQNRTINGSRVFLVSNGTPCWSLFFQVRVQTEIILDCVVRYSKPIVFRELFMHSFREIGQVLTSHYEAISINELIGKRTRNRNRRRTRRRSRGICAKRPTLNH